MFVHDAKRATPEYDPHRSWTPAPRSNLFATDPDSESRPQAPPQVAVRPNPSILTATGEPAAAENELVQSHESSVARSPKDLEAGGGGGDGPSDNKLRLLERLWKDLEQKSFLWVAVRMIWCGFIFAGLALIEVRTAW